MPSEHLLHDGALDSAPPPVYEADLRVPLGQGCCHVLLHHRRNVPRVEGVQVERIFDWYSVRHAAGKEAVTWVEMPPLAVKLPTTVIRLGEQAATRSSRIWLVAAS